MKESGKSARGRELRGSEAHRKPSFRKILVPVDFSKSSRDALDYARELAAQHDSTVILLHVVEPMVYPVEVGYPSLGALPLPARLPLQSSYERAGRTRLEKWHREAAGKGVKIQASLRVGPPYFEIARAATELGADLIVISTHGHTGLKHVFLGSTAERVVRHATCPVLTLRRRK
jgi:universal stress protein A